MKLIDPTPIYDMMEFNKKRHGFVELHASDLDKLPRIDAVEVVRCKDCKHVLEKHYEEPGEPPYIKYLCYCPYGLSNRYGVDKNDFCSRGEHKKAGE